MLRRLHPVRLQDKWVKEILRKTLDGDEVSKTFEQPGAFGGPHTGFLNDGNAFLHSIMKGRKLKKEFCSIEPVEGSQGDNILSSFEGLGSISINDSDVEKWAEEAVFCHNDPTPRNLLLRRGVSFYSTSKYKLAGIIDWELAGFLPCFV